MRAPEFWWQERPSALARVLSPLGQAFGAITRRRMQRSGTRLSIPVICIGNFVAGGAGKTPTAIAIARRLDARGEAPYFLSRGYGATARPQGGPILVDPAKHSASEVGDEPLLLVRHAPTIVAADRVAAARMAIKAGASVLVMDDGLQNPALHKDLSIAVVDSATGIGNGLCIPAGPLRAPLADQLIGVDALVTIGGGPRAKGPTLMARERALPVIEAVLEPDASGRARLARQKVVAFAGIGRPEKFFKTLRELGANVAQALPFPDHHPYSSADISMLKSAARQAGAMLVTTEKDYVRLQHLKDLPPIDTLAVTLEPRQTEAFDQLLDDLLRA
ncbi:MULTISPECIES: tetraacyldisaccharide 4'-kinase [unclassified Beijerinckia]|uniref:tetraacyldisaccharide 4'-kinase n=1 Tax=unclassified Beijerinckia TaxID=2638183 RepID=UPI00089594A2|nr:MULTISPECIES: tetraacyldisaccharide 4'-kinase [unclassified Beijerinckia]MDH7796700.1 tetraacyldisaccharide 4'-kinase [Beijerinckia sp. GAS462]SEC56282.1 lipid-A-disaccharide kinase [Beijerinckia sp. 28-YEA-48]